MWKIKHVILTDTTWKGVFLSCIALRMSCRACTYAADVLPSAAPKSSSSVTTSPPVKVTIFRREIAEGNVKSFPLSIDVPQKKFIDSFNDFENKRCKLCNESYMQWSSHIVANIPHTAREAVALEMVRAYCGTPEELVKFWWERLHSSPKFRRIPSLSHDNSFKRKRRIQYLLTFLRDKKVLRECFNVAQSQVPSSVASAARSFEFERLEWVGDNVVKYMFQNRIQVLFPYSEGGVRGKLTMMQFMMDGNEGLARAYDHLELQKLTMSKHVVSKFKSDVVETLFGELQLYLWSTQTDLGTEYYATPFTTDMVSLRELVFHVMEETAHCIVMYHLDFILQNMQRVMKENQILLVRSDPSLANRPGAQRELASSIYSAAAGGPGAAGKRGSGKTISPQRCPVGSHSGRELFQLQTNYDAFKQVFTLGGLLPRPFSRSGLTATPSFLPMVQECPPSESLAAKWRDGPASSWIGSAQDAVHLDVADSPRSLLRAPEVRAASAVSTPWNILSLKDAGLVPELI